MEASRAGTADRGQDDQGVTGSQPDGCNRDVQGIEQEEGMITTLPSELMLLIFGYLDSQDLVSSTAKVSKKWQQLACDPVLWRNRFIYYDPQRPGDFIEHMRNLCDQIRYLHLGGHVALEERALKALLSKENILVKHLDYLGSCRTNPSNVIKVLAKFSLSIEELSICLNDELVSYGKDGKTCYALSLKARQGLLVTLIGNMKNLKYLKLCGGFKTQWYFSELLGEACSGCNNIQTLDLKDFEEVSDNFRSCRKLDFVQSLILRNKNHLHCLKLSETCKFNVQSWIRECQKTLKELSINMAHIDCLNNSCLSLSCLELSGKSQLDWSNEINILPMFSQATHTLEQVNLIYLQEKHFSSIIKSFECVQVLRLEGNVMNGENINAILKYLPFLTKLCVRESNAVSKNHLVLMELNLSSLRAFDFEQICDLDCFSTKVMLQHIPILKLKIFTTGCNCRNRPHEHDQNFYRVEDVHQNVKNEKNIHFSMSSVLCEEFLAEFQDFHKNDIAFHFRL